MEKVNGCPKGIGLRNNLRKILWEKKKKKKISGFSYFPWKWCLKFLNWFINNYPKGTN